MLVICPFLIMQWVRLIWPCNGFWAPLLTEYTDAKLLVNVESNFAVYL